MNNDIHMQIIRIGLLINRAKCKRFLLDYARASRAHKFTRVSLNTLCEAEGALKNWLKLRVNQTPSKGKTL